MNKYIKFIIWIIATLIVISLTTSALTVASTFFNICGFLLGALYIKISYDTKCFTNIKFKKNEENS